MRIRDGWCTQSVLDRSELTRSYVNINDSLNDFGDCTILLTYLYWDFPTVRAQFISLKNHVLKDGRILFHHVQMGNPYSI
jgi:hypothetical protein